MGNKGLIVILIILLLILVGLVGGGAYLYSTGYFDPKSDINGTKHDTNKTKPLPEHRGDLEDLTFNVTDAQGKAGVLSMSLYAMTTLPQIQSLFEVHKGQISDAIMKQCEARSADELLTFEGKNVLKEDIIADIITILKSDKSVKNVEIGKIHFTKFTIK